MFAAPYPCLPAGAERSPGTPHGRRRPTAAWGAMLVIASLLSAGPAAAQRLELERALEAALAEDPGLLALTSAAASEEALAVAESAFPDPEIALAAQNFPVDTFDFGQEPMTQYRVALRQPLPRGRTRSLEQERYGVRAEQYRLRARDRRATIVRAVSLAWVDGVRDTRIDALLQESEPLFAELARIAESAYSVGYGSQQDVIRARLEQLHLQDREIRVAEQVVRSRVALSRWVGGLSALPLPAAPATIPAPRHSPAEWEALMQDHPSVAVLELAVDERELEVELARQAYRPRFALEVAYGARGGEDMDGRQRPDFLSVGMTFDLPLFAANRQDQRLSAARYMQSAASSRRLDRIRQLQGELAEALRRRQELDARLDLYRAEILPASEQAARAALAGYRADANDFAEVMRAHIAALDARIELETLRSDLLANAVELGYLAGEED